MPDAAPPPSLRGRRASACEERFRLRGRPETPPDIRDPWRYEGSWEWLPRPPLPIRRHHFAGWLFRGTTPAAPGWEGHPIPGRWLPIPHWRTQTHWQRMRVHASSQFARGPRWSSPIRGRPGNRCHASPNRPPPPRHPRPLSSSSCQGVRRTRGSGARPAR